MRCAVHGDEPASVLRVVHAPFITRADANGRFTLPGVPAVPVRVELTTPDGAGTWEFGPADAESAITGAAGEFCRVAARRLDPARTGLRASGPGGATALRLVRTYAA